MNATGFEASGFSLSSMESFNSVPGLKLFIDPHFVAEFATANRIKRILDQSDYKYHFSQPSNQWPYQITGEGGFKAVNIQDLHYLEQDPNNFKFLSDGSPFGFYTIHKQHDRDDQMSIFTTANASFAVELRRGFQLIYDDRQSLTRNNRIRVNIFSNSGFALNFDSNSYAINPDIINKITVIGYGYNHPTENDVKLLINDVLQTSANYSFPLDSGVPNTCRYGQSVPNATVVTSNRYDGYLPALAYDWTGYTAEQINGFNDSVTSIMQTIYGEILP